MVQEYTEMSSFIQVKRPEFKHQQIEYGNQIMKQFEQTEKEAEKAAEKEKVVEKEKAVEKEAEKAVEKEKVVEKAAEKAAEKKE